MATKKKEEISSEEKVDKELYEEAEKESLSTEKKKGLKSLEEKKKELLERAKKIKEEARKNALELQQKNDELIKKNTEIKLSEADKKAESIVDSANREIEKERWSMLEEMKSKVLDLSLKINWKVFWDASKNKEFVEKEVNLINA